MALLATVLSFVCLAPARALGSTTEQSILMDDDQLIYSAPDHVVSVMQRLHSLGVDRVKVSVAWLLVAPQSDSSHRPSFDATDPGAYPAGAWDRYDLIVEEAAQLGMQVYFQLDPPAPLWAIPPHQAKQGPRLGLAPDMREFRRFVAAVGRRYSGTYQMPAAQHDEELVSLPPGVPNIGLRASQSSQGSNPPPLPRVDYWGVWNEPNERSWLSPTSRAISHHRREPLQPLLYRELVDAAWSGLVASGHRGDTFLIGETANRGILTPGDFIREVFCVSSSGRPLRGAAAALVGCPTSGSAASFVTQHPGLFDATGFAHHPYAFDTPPDRPYFDRSFYTLDNLSALEALLDSVTGAYGRRPSGGVPLYLTEWGYKSDPPNPYARTSLAEQATWLDEGEYVTWRLPYVRALTQFLLVDDRPRTQARVGSAQYWSSFQTGLMTMDGNPKPSYGAYRIPIWVPSPRHGSSVTVWGQLRPADHSTTQYGVLEFRPAGSNSWQSLRVVETDSPEGFVLVHVAIPSPGQLRLAWLTPDDDVDVSRSVTIR